MCHALAEGVVDALSMVDENSEALGAGELDCEHFGTRKRALDLGGDLPRQLLFLLMCGGHAPVTKNGPAGPFRKLLEMWCQQDSKSCKYRERQLHVARPLAKDRTLAFAARIPSRAGHRTVRVAGESPVSERATFTLAVTLWPARAGTGDVVGLETSRAGAVGREGAGRRQRGRGR